MVRPGPRPDNLYGDAGRGAAPTLAFGISRPTQPDLFAGFMLADTLPTADDQNAGWERRALSDMAAEPLVYCHPGFMGAVCERLVAQGLARCESAGFLAPPATLTRRELKVWGWKAEDHPQFRYSITDAGRAILAAQQEAAH